MHSWKSHFGSEHDARCRDLERRLRIFYSSVPNYDAYRERNWKPEFWMPVRSAVDDCIARHGCCRVLEVGAGRTAFADFLADLRRRVEFHVQDITARNRRYLSAIADRVWICEVAQIRESFDVIFSTFAYEHMTAPRATLNHMLSMLRPGGALFIASPRYDFPGYLSPSVRHLPRRRQLAIAVQLLAKRIRVACGGPPLFLLHFDPAAFHRPWFRDADAVHWPSVWDVKRLLEERGGAVMRPLRIDSQDLWGTFWARFLLLFVQIQLDPAKHGDAQRPTGCVRNDRPMREDSNRESETCLN